MDNEGKSITRQDKSTRLPPGKTRQDKKQKQDEYKTIQERTRAVGEYNTILIKNKTGRQAGKASYWGGQ